VNRPLLAVAVGADATGDPVRALVRALSRRCDVRALSGCSRRPDAVLAVGVDVLASVPAGVRAAVFVEEAAAVEDVPGDVLALAADGRAPEVHAGRGVVVVPKGAIDAESLPPLSLLLRRRWRARLGLPDLLLVAVAAPDPAPALHGVVDVGSAADVPTALAVASAAVVTGAWLSTALALGTPVVTDWGSASGLRAADGEHVIVRPVERVGEALDHLARSELEAAPLARRARLLVEERLDIGTVAGAVASHLGFSPPPAPRPTGSASIDERLDELRTPAVAHIRTRAAAAVAALAAPPQEVQ